MNDNFKNSLITIFGTSWTIPAGMFAFSWYQDGKKDDALIITTLILLSIALVLSFIFFGPKEFPRKLLFFLKKNIKTMLALTTLAVGINLFITNAQSLDEKGRLVLLVVMLVAWSYTANKIRILSNLRIIKSFLKEDLELMDSWTATETDNEQQTDYREIPLKGKSLKKLVFTIKPSSPFWRVGFKLTDPNGSILPLRTDNSLLFHLGSTDQGNKVGITAYINGKWVKSLNKSLLFNNDNPINITLEINDKNFIKCYVNDQVEFEPAGRIDPRMLKKAFLAAWGDGHNMRVEFDSIGFSTR